MNPFLVPVQIMFDSYRPMFRFSKEILPASKTPLPDLIASSQPDHYDYTLVNYREFH